MNENDIKHKNESAMEEEAIPGREPIISYGRETSKAEM